MPEPVSISELKAFARIEGDDDDDLIESLGVAAREYVEQATGKTFTSPIPERAALVIKLLVAHWMEQRSPLLVREAIDGVVELTYRPNAAPTHIRALIHQLRDWGHGEANE